MSVPHVMTIQRIVVKRRHSLEESCGLTEQHFSLSLLQYMCEYVCTHVHM